MFVFFSVHSHILRMSISVTILSRFCTMAANCVAIGVTWFTLYWRDNSCNSTTIKGGISNVLLLDGNASSDIQRCHADRTCTRNNLLCVSNSYGSPPHLTTCISRTLAVMTSFHLVWTIISVRSYLMSTKHYTQVSERTARSSCSTICQRSHQFYSSVCI